LEGNPDPTRDRLACAERRSEAPAFRGRKGSRVEGGTSGLAHLDLGHGAVTPDGDQQHDGRFMLGEELFGRILGRDALGDLWGFHLLDPWGSGRLSHRKARAGEADAKRGTRRRERTSARAAGPFLTDW
jgi:hypothetical protein